MSETSGPYVLVVGIDYSETGKQALDCALQMASEKPTAEVHVVNVLEPTPDDALKESAAYRSEAEFLSLEEAGRRLKKYVTKASEQWRATGQTPMRIILHQRFEAPAREVAQLAADLEADLVVVGTHGRRGITRLVMGSVAEAVVRLAPCPVLVVRPKAIPEPVPAIQPPCPRCVEARKSSRGSEFWCEQHRERHGQRHTYHQGDRLSAETNMPLVFHS